MQYFNDQNLFLIRMKHDDATVVHDFGVILLEMIKGRPVKCTTQVGVLKDQVKALCFILIVSSETHFPFCETE